MNIVSIDKKDLRVEEEAKEKVLAAWKVENQTYSYPLQLILSNEVKVMLDDEGKWTRRIPIVVRLAKWNPLEGKYECNMYRGYWNLDRYHESGAQGTFSFSGITLSYEVSTALTFRVREKVHEAGLDRVEI